MNPEQRADVRRVRHVADIIGITVILELAINLAILVLLRFIPDAQNALLEQLGEIVSYVVIFFVPFALMTHWNGWTLRELNGDGRPGPLVFLMAICLAAGWNFIATMLSVGVEEIIALFGYTEPAAPYVQTNGMAELLLQILEIALIPPVVEELCFRGFYLKLAQRAMGIWPAIVLSSVLFWLAHNSISILPLAFGFGILGGVLRVTYRSLLPSMCAHFVVNGSYILVNWVQSTQPPMWQHTLSLLFVFVELLCLIAGILLAHRLGLFAAARAYARDSWLVERRDLLRGLLTSVPFWVILLSAAYFSHRGLEVLG